MAEDMRVRRTKRLLKGAFAEMIAQTPLTKMSVKALCERADVSKQAFYLHYSDIYALADEWVVERIDEMVAGLDFLPLYYAEPREFIRRFGGFFAANKDFGLLLFRNDLHQVFLRQFTDAVVSCLVELRPKGMPEMRSKVAATMVVSGLLALPTQYGAVPLEPPLAAEPAAPPAAGDPMAAVAEDAAAVIAAINAAL